MPVDRAWTEKENNRRRVNEEYTAVLTAAKTGINVAGAVHSRLVLLPVVMGGVEMVELGVETVELKNGEYETLNLKLEMLVHTLWLKRLCPLALRQTNILRHLHQCWCTRPG